MNDYDPQTEDPWADAPAVPRTVERTPPHDLVAEQSVLGAMLISPRAIQEVTDLLHGGDFYDPHHETIFDAIMSLTGAGSPVDAITVNDELARTGRHVPQGAAYAHELASVVPTAANVVFYAEIVAERAARRRLIEAGTSAVQAGFEPGDIGVVLEGFRTDLEHAQGDRQILLEPIGSLFDEVRADMENPPPLIPTPWVEVNSLMGGLMDGGLYIVGARPGAGKTMSGLQIAATLAERGPVAFSALEMSSKQMLQRLIAQKGQVSMSSLSRHDLSAGEAAQFDMVRPNIDRLPIFVDDRSGVSVQQMKAFARQVNRKGKLAGYVVDYLQLVSSHDRGVAVHEMVGEIARQLKLLARELECPVIVLSQLNRESVTVKGGKGSGQRPPTLADLSKSDAIGHHADAVLMLQRRLEITGDVGDILDVFLVKNRQGNLGRCSLKFEGKYMRIVSKPIGLF